MKTNYKWETEDEGEWVEETSLSALPQRRLRSRPLILLGLVVIIAFGLIFYLFERRLEAREEIVRQNVIAAHRTWEQAVIRQDLELFTSLLARDDMDWYQSQRRLLMSGRALDRAPMGMNRVNTVGDTPEIELDANWRQAELTYPQRYAVNGGSEGDITLMMTHVYRIRGSRWQAAEPDESFWGGSRTEEFGHLVVTFPGRDAAVVERLASDLSREIDEACSANEAARECSSEWRVPVIFDTDPESLLALGDAVTPVIQGRTFILPAPSLVGVPADEAAYTALYHGYIDRIMNAWRNDLALPLPLPDQDIAALCFPAYNEGLSLYTYRPATDTWTRQSEARRFSFIQPLPDDSGLVLRTGFPGVELAHLELVLRQAGEETPLFKEGTTELSARLDGIPYRPNNESLLLSAVQGSTGLTDYRLLPLNSCRDGVCDVNPLAGFPLWSPDGNSSLVLVGSELYLGDSEGAPGSRIGRAFSPFWVTNDVFGFVRLMGDLTTAESPDMELVLRSAATGEERLLIRSAELLGLIDSDFAGTFRIMYAAASPTDPNLVFLAGTPVAGGEGRFYVLKLRLDGDTETFSSTAGLAAAEVILALDDLPVGDPSTLTPTGYPPFSITPDGRRLLVARFSDPVTNTWVLYLHDIDGKDTQVFTLNYPAYPAPFPFYDWSADGNWLLLVDNGFLRLVAPDYEYERVVTHDFAACRYPAWIDRAVVEAAN